MKVAALLSILVAADLTLALHYKCPAVATLTVKVKATSVPVTPSTPSTARPAFQYASGHRLVMYHTNWACYERNYNVVDLPIDYMSDVNYAFFDLIKDSNGLYVPDSADPWADFQKRFTTADVGVLPLDPVSGADTATYGNFGQFIKLRNAGKKFNFGISIGGWSSSGYYSVAMRSQITRAAFISKLMYWLALYPKLIDRFDFDWEYISAPGQNYGLTGNQVNVNDAVNFGYFLKTFRETLDAAGFTNVEMTACTTADPDNVAALPIKSMITYLDTFNVMTYDFKSSEWGPTLAGHNSNLVATAYATNSVQKAVAAFMALGVPASKINIGVPYYTRGFANTLGLGLASNGVVSSKSWEVGMSDYKSLPWPGATEFYDAAAVAGYSYDPVKKELLSYDTVKVVNEKLRYLWDLGLKGVIVWESSGDFPVTNTRSLTRALYNGLQARP